MTDEQIVKAMEYCASTKPCKECPICNKDNCAIALTRNAFDLIKRQQAEIERLHEVINGFEEQSHKELMEYMRLSEKYETARAEAVREFAERLKKRLDRKHTIYGREYVLRHMQELVIEMTEKEGGNNGTEDKH